MATRASTVDYVIDQASGAGHLSAKKMFGEYGLYCDGKLVALVCDDQLFLKPTDAVRELLGARAVEARPYPTAKPCLLISAEHWEDRDGLAKLIRLTTASLPPFPRGRRGPERRR